ncbi:MAG: outer membrane protein assembly factor BamB family protein [Ktedonobacterales bacterium]
MQPIPRMLLLACFLASIVAVAACGVRDTGGSSGVNQDYNVARCDGSPIAHAPLSEQPPHVPSSFYVTTQTHVGSGESGISALTAHDGTPRWCVRFALTRTYTCPPQSHCPPPPIALVGMPLVAAGVLYVCVSGPPSGVLYALNAADGALRWSRQTGCKIFSMPFENDAQPILVDGVLYSGAFGLAPHDGTVLWQLPPQVANSAFEIGAVANGVAYAYNEETVSAVRLSDSTVAWTYTLDSPIGGRPVPVGNHLYVGDIAGNSPPAVTRGLPDTYALDTRTGAVLWRSPTGIVASSSAVEVDGLVYIGGDNALNAIDATTGVIHWRVRMPYDGYVEGTPVVSNSIVNFVGDGAYAVDAATGAVRWHNALGWNLSKSYIGPALRDGTLYLVGIDGSGQGTLYALDATSGAIRWQRSDINPAGMPVT